MRVVSNRLSALFTVSLSLFMPQLDYYKENFQNNHSKINTNKGKCFKIKNGIENCIFSVVSYKWFIY